MQFTGLAGQKDKKPRGGGQNPGTKRNRRPTDVARSMASRNNRWGVEQPRLIELDSKYQQREKVGAARLDAAEHVISSLQQPYALAKKLNLITFWLKDWDDVLPPEVLNQDLLDPDSMVSQAEANAIAVLKEKRKLDSTPEPFGKDPSINKASQTLPIKAPHVSHWEDYRADPAPPRQVSANKRPDPLPSVVPVPPVLSRNERIEPPSCIPVLPEKSAKKIVRPSKHAPLSVSLRSTAPASDLEQENCQLDKLEFSIQFAFLIARLDGTLSPSAKKLIHDYFQEQYASEAALANRAKAYCVHLERGPIKFENGIGQFHKLFTADERSRLISLGGQIIQASDRENKKAVALLQKMAGDLKSSLVLENAAVKTPEPPPDSPQPLATQPLATQCTPLATSKDDYLRILEIDPSLTISADFVRRQFNHVCGKYAPERAASLDREFVELFDKKREEIKIAEIKIAATALLQELGEELESTTSSQPKALRENPDLDKEFGVGSMSLYDDISLTDSDRKTKEVFGDQVVVKSLSQHNVFHGLPRFVSEYLIAKYVRPESWKEDLAKVQAKIRDLLPDLDRRELIKERLLSAGEVTLIDNVEVRVDLRNGQRWGRIPAINDERIRVSGSI